MDTLIFWIVIFSIPIAFYLWLIWMLLKVRLGARKKTALLVIISIPWLIFLQAVYPYGAVHSDNDGSLYSLQGNFSILYLLSLLSLYYLAKSYFQKVSLRYAFIILSLVVLGLMLRFSLFESSNEFANFKDSRGNRYIVTAKQDFNVMQVSIKRCIVDLFLVKLVRLEAGGWREMSYISMPIDGEETLYSNFIEQACPREKATSISPTVSRSMRDNHWLILESEGHLIFNPRVINGELKIPLLYDIGERKVLKGYEIKKLPDFSRLQCILDRSLPEALHQGIQV